MISENVVKNCILPRSKRAYPRTISKTQSQKYAARLIIYKNMRIVRIVIRAQVNIRITYIK